MVLQLHKACNIFENVKLVSRESLNQFQIILPPKQCCVQSTCEKSGVARAAANRETFLISQFVRCGEAQIPMCSF